MPNVSAVVPDGARSAPQPLVYIYIYIGVRGAPQRISSSGVLDLGPARFKLLFVVCCCRLPGGSRVGRGWVAGSFAVIYYTLHTGACNYAVIYYTCACSGGECVVNNSIIACRGGESVVNNSKVACRGSQSVVNNSKGTGLCCYLLHFDHLEVHLSCYLLHFGRPWSPKCSK